MVSKEEVKRKKVRFSGFQEKKNRIARTQTPYYRPSNTFGKTEKKYSRSTNKTRKLGKQ